MGKQKNKSKNKVPRATSNSPQVPDDDDDNSLPTKGAAGKRGEQADHITRSLNLLLLMLFLSGSQKACCREDQNEA